MRIFFHKVIVNRKSIISILNLFFFGFLYNQSYFTGVFFWFSTLYFLKIRLYYGSYKRGQKETRQKICWK